MKRDLSLKASVLFCATLVVSTLLAQSGFTYVYDELGRLIAAIDPASDTVVYNYDAVGNLTSIDRRSSTQVSIIDFSPKSGPVGTAVTIYGTGFSSTASQNTVQFNGATATVTSATANKIVTSVPAGATTGPISVSAPSGSTTTSRSFSVTSKAPEITSFTPTVGLPGTSVTVSGNNFESSLSNNRLRFNGKRAIVSTASTTSLSTSAPDIGSGKISVETPYGKATSAADFFVPPSPYTAADVEVTGRMAFGETRTVTLATANKIALIVFDAVAGQRFSLNKTNVTITSGGNVTVYNPDRRPTAQ